MPVITPSEVFEFFVPGAEPEDEDPTDEELQGLVSRQIEEALSWREEHLDPEMEKATDYYMGRPYGDEREGRSQVVTTDVRDAVQAIMPSLMRVFTSSERVVEFKPRGPEDVASAKQQTEYVNYIFQEDNEGFLILHSVLKDALVRKLGIAKWWWEEKTCVEGSEHSGLTAEGVEILRAEPGVTLEVLEEYDAYHGGSEEQIPTFDVRIIRDYDKSRVRVAAVPPEEFIFSPSARSLDEARIVGQVQERSASDLIAMGVPEKLIKDSKGRDTRMATNRLATSRKIDEGARELHEDEQDPATRPVPFAEVYVQYDEDEDGVAELHKVQCVGDSWTIWQDEVVDDVPFALFMVDPEPHTIVGLSTADYLMDLQRIHSHLTRGMLDSLVQHINPATEVVEGEVNMSDVLNQELGRVVRVRRPGMMREVPTEFVGGNVLPVMQRIEEQKADRVGVTKASAGLDPDALQSTTRAGVDATVQAAQQRLELLARILAETGMKRLFRGLLKTVVQHQDQPRVVRLRGEFTPIDPRHWDADMDAIVNVALGTGLVEQKLEMLGLIAGKQEEHLQQGSPLVDFAKIRATYARMIELMGYRNPEEFFSTFGPQEQQAYAQQQAQNQKPDETEVFKEIEMAKIQARSQEKQAEMQLKRAELQLKQAELQLKRATEARSLGIKEADVDRKTRVDLTDQAIERARLELEAQASQVDALQKLSQTRVGE